MEKYESSVDPYGDGTPTRDALERMANRWTILVTHVLEDGPTRFNSIKYRLGVSSQVLTRVLRELERDGLIKRRAFAEVPTRVEYSLTPLGGTMCSVVHEVRRWAETNSTAITEAREIFDRNN
ncbi:MAG: helix-turn-helix domain-containing protein [Acidimicrobiales bacterium]|jgi:DNA-binding HxlR family transcriptional regulator